MQTNDQNHDQQPKTKNKKNVWDYLLYAIYLILIFIAGYFVFKIVQKVRSQKTEQTEQPINDPGNTLPTPIDSTNIKRAEEAEARAEAAEEALADMKAQLDSLTKQPAQPGITQPDNGQQQPTNPNNGASTLMPNKDGYYPVLQSETAKLTGKKKAVGTYFRLPDGHMAIVVRQ